MKTVSIIDHVLDPKYWHHSFEQIHYTGHMYYNSPFESDDNCGTCDGARCDTCKKITIPAGIECGIPTDELKELLIKVGVPENVAADMAYDDFYSPIKSGWKLIWPDENELKSKYPEKYDEMFAGAAPY